MNKDIFNCLNETHAYYPNTLNKLTPCINGQKYNTVITNANPQKILFCRTVTDYECKQCNFSPVNFCVK